MHHRANNLLRGNGTGNIALRVHRLKLQAAQAGIHATRQKPPGYAIHRRQHQGLRADQRRNLARHVGHGRGFDGYHHHVLHTQRSGVLLRIQSHSLTLIIMHQRQAVLLQCSQRLPTRHGAQLATCLGQRHAQPAANGSCAVNTHFFRIHSCLSF